MTNWKREIQIKQFLGGDPFEDVRDNVVRVLKAQPEYDFESDSLDEDFYLLVDEMADSESVRHFDLALEALYDWADANLIWIGGRWFDPELAKQKERDDR